MFTYFQDEDENALPANPTTQSNEFQIDNSDSVDALTPACPRPDDMVGIGARRRTTFSEPAAVQNPRRSRRSAGDIGPTVRRSTSASSSSHRARSRSPTLSPARNDTGVIESSPSDILSRVERLEQASVQFSDRDELHTGSRWNRDHVNDNRESQYDRHDVVCNHVGNTALPPVEARMIAKIRSGEFIHFEQLLVNSVSPTNPSRFPFSQMIP